MQSTGLNPLIRLDQPESEREHSPVDIIVTEEGEMSLSLMIRVR